MTDRNTIVIFGASGDLTHRKLMPALFDLFTKDRLPEGWQIVGVARTKLTDDEFRAQMEEAVKQYNRSGHTPQRWAEFAANLRYLTGDINNLDDLQTMDATIEATTGDGRDNRIYYLAIAPKLYDETITNLGQAGLATETDGWRRVVIEKPFGDDLDSARALNELVHEVLDESQVYRIDHYLGKETVQNILVFRFANSMYEPVWNRNYIDHVQITAAETVDIGHRASYYEGVGVMRDMVQNHMLQLLALVAIEPPASFGANAVRDEKYKLLRAVRPIRPEDVATETVRGQYIGYRQAEGVAEGSETATFVALRYYIDNWRWQGVPFYLRSGKALASKSTEITIFFRRPPHLLFPLPDGTMIPPNSLSICIQPDEGIHFSFQAKVPDTISELRSVDMSFHYAEAFGATAIPEAYERLLLDVFKGDASLFTRADSIEVAWALVDPVLEGWSSPDAPPLCFYEPGTWGPPEAETLLDHDGYQWTMGCAHDD